MSAIDELLKLLKAGDQIAADVVKAIEPVLTSSAFDDALTDAIKNADLSDIDDAIKKMQESAIKADGLTRQAKEFLTGDAFKATLKKQIHETRFLDDGNAILVSGGNVDVDALRKAYTNISDTVADSLKKSADLREDVISGYADDLASKYPNASADELNDYSRELWVYGQKKNSLGDAFTDPIPDMPASVTGKKIPETLDGVTPTKLIPEYAPSKVQTAIKWTPLLGKVGFNTQEALPHAVFSGRYIDPVIAFVDDAIDSSGLISKINKLNDDLKKVGESVGRKEISMAEAQEVMATKARAFSVENGDELKSLRNNLQGVRKELADQKYLAPAVSKNFDARFGTVAPHLTGILKPQLESLRSFVNDIDDMARSLINPNDELQGFVAREIKAADALLKPSSSAPDQAVFMNTRFDNLLKLGSGSETRRTKKSIDGNKAYVENHDSVRRAILEGAYNDNIRSQKIIEPVDMQNSENTLMVTHGEYKNFIDPKTQKVVWPDQSVEKFMGQLEEFKVLGNDHDAVYLIRSLQNKLGRTSLETFPKGIKDEVAKRVSEATDPYEKRFYETIKEAVGSVPHNDHFLKQRHVRSIYDSLTYWPRMARRYAGDNMLSYPATNHFVKEPTFRALHEGFAFVTGGKSVHAPTAGNSVNRDLKYNWFWDKDYKAQLPEKAGFFRKAGHTIAGIPPAVIAVRLASGGIASPLGKALATGGLSTTTGRTIWGTAAGVSALSWGIEAGTDVIADNTDAEWLRGFDGEGGLGFNVLNRALPTVVRAGVGMSDFVLDDWAKVSTGALSSMFGYDYSAGIDVAGIYDSYAPDFFTGANGSSSAKNSPSSTVNTKVSESLEGIKDASEDRLENALKRHESIGETLKNLGDHITAFGDKQIRSIESHISTLDPASDDYKKFTDLKSELQIRLGNYYDNTKKTLDMSGPLSLAALHSIEKEDILIQDTDSPITAKHAWKRQNDHVSAHTEMSDKITAKVKTIENELKAISASIAVNDTLPPIILTAAEKAIKDKADADAKAAEVLRLAEAARIAAEAKLNAARDTNTAAQDALKAKPNDPALQAAAQKSQTEYDTLNAVEIARQKTVEDARIAAAAKAQADADKAEAVRLAKLSPEEKAAEVTKIEKAARDQDPLYDEHEGASAALADATKDSERVIKLYGSEAIEKTAAFLVAGMQTQQIDKVKALSEEMFDKGDHTAVGRINELLADMNGNNRAAEEYLDQLGQNKDRASALQKEITDLNIQIQGITAPPGSDETDETKNKVAEAQELIKILKSKTDAVEIIKTESEALHKQISTLVSNNAALLQQNPDTKHHFGTGGTFEKGAIAAGGGEYGLLNQFIGSTAGGTSVIGGYFNMASSKLKDGMDWWSEVKRGAKTQGEMNGYNLAEQGFLAFMSIVALNKVGEWTGMSQGVKIAALIGIIGYFIHRSGATGQDMRDHSDAKNPFAQVNPSLRGRNNIPTVVSGAFNGSKANNAKDTKSNVVTLTGKNGEEIKHKLNPSGKQDITAQSKDGEVPTNIIDLDTARVAKEQADKALAAGQGSSKNIPGFVNKADEIKIVPNSETGAQDEHIVPLADNDNVTPDISIKVSAQ